LIEIKVFKLGNQLVIWCRDYFLKREGFYCIIKIKAFLKGDIMKNYLLDFFKGMVIGIGAIAPGVSGGAIAVIFGVYENLTRAIGNIFNDFWRKVTYLAPIGLGAGLGILVFSNIFKYLFENYNTQVRYLFVGLMAGTFPSLFKTANREGFRWMYVVPLLISLSISIIFSIYEDTIINTIPHDEPDLIQLIIYGIIVAIGTVIPGLSSSVMLIYINAYDFVLEAMATLDFSALIPMGIGFVLCFFVLFKIISFMFDRAYGLTYYTILGFVLGSIIPIFPGFNFNMEYIISGIILLAGFFLSYNLSKFARE